MFFPSTSSSSTPSTSFASSNDANHRPHPNHQPRSRAHSTLSLPTTASASVHVRYLYLAGRYRDLSEEHGLGIVGKTGGLLDQVQEESKDRDNSFNTFSGSETDGSIGTSKGGSISQKNNKRRSIRLNDIFLGASSNTNNSSSSSNNNTSSRLHSTPTSSSKIHAPHGARHGSLRGYAQQRLKIQEKIEGRIRRATDTKRLEWEAQAALLASSHPLALLLLTRAGVLGSNSASLQLASLYSSGIVRGVSPSVVLVHRDPIRAISWLIRSNEILRLQVETIDQEREKLKRDLSLSGANRRGGGVGHRRSLSGQSQRAGLIPSIKSSEATSKLIANCPFSLMTSKSLEDPLTLLNILVRVLRTNQTNSCNGEILNVELINVLEEGSKGIKMTFDEERQNSNNGSSEKANGQKKELWQEVQKLVNWMESRLPNGKQSQNHQDSSNDSISNSKRFLTQAQVKIQASKESNQASLDAKGPSSELPLSPINQNTNPNTSYQANTSDPQASTSSEPVFSPGPDDVDEMIGVASNLREVKTHLSFLNVLMGVRDFALAFSSNAHESEENPYQILMLKLETLISILEKVSLCSESDQTLPFSSSSFKAHQMEPISRSSSTIVSLSKQTIPMIKDLFSLIKALKVSYDEKKDESDLKEKVKDGLKEIGELMEGSLSEILVPTIPSNGISNGSEITSSLSSSHSNKRLKSSSSTNDLKNRRRKSLEDLVPMDIDSTQQLKDSQRPSLLSFPSSQSNLNLAQTKVDNVIAPGEAPIHKRQLGRTLSSVVQLRGAMPSTTNSTGSNRDLLSPADSLMSNKSGYGFPSSSVSQKGSSSGDPGWNSLGLGPGSTAKRRPSSVVSDSPSLLFPNHQDENFNLGDGEDSRANSPSQERGQLQRSDSVNSSASLWTGSIARRRDGNASSSSRRRVTSLYGEPSTAGMDRSVSGTNDLLDSSDFDADSNQMTSSSSAQYFNSSGQFDPTKSLRELHSSRRRGSVISNSSTNSNFSNFSSNLPFFGKSDARPPSMRSLSSKASLSSLNVNEHGLAHQMNGSAALGRQAVDSLRRLRGQLPTSSSSRNFASDSQNNGEQFDSDFVYQPRRRTGSSASMPAHLINDNQRSTSTNNTGIEPNYGFPTLRRTLSTSSNHSQLGSSSRIPSLRPRPPSMLSPSLSFLQTSISPPEESSSSRSRNVSSGTFSRNGTLSPTSPISPTSPNPSNSALGTLRKIGLEAQSRKRAGLPEGMRSPEQVNSASSKDEVKDKAGELTSKKSNGNLTNKTTRSFMGIDPTKANSLYGSLSNPSSTNPTPTHPRSPLSPSPSGGTLSGARSPLSDDSDSVQNGSGGGKGKGRAFDSDQLDAVLAQAEERSRLKTDSFCDECGTLVVNAPISKSGLKFCGRDCRMQSKEREKEKRKELERRREIKEKEAKEEKNWRGKGRDQLERKSRQLLFEHYASPTSSLQSF